VKAAGGVDMNTSGTGSEAEAARSVSTQRRKLAVYWAASCGGCDIALLNINEKILEVAEAFDIIFWPCVADGKVRDVEKLPDASIDLCLFNGGIRNSEHEYMARLLRAKSKILVAFGSCAIEGGIPGLVNLHTRDEVFATVYGDMASTENPHGILPQYETEVADGILYLPRSYDTLKTLPQTVFVDYHLPGCPPEPDRIWEFMTAAMNGRFPAPATIQASKSTVCDECPRRRSEKKIKRFYRPWEIIPDPEICLLDQGLICCGIATRAGCGALCPQVNSPCTGCYGPPDAVEDSGARLMSALASIIDSQDPEEINRIIKSAVPDPVGTFYRFGLAGSLLRRAQRPQAKMPPNIGGAGSASPEKANVHAASNATSDS